MAEASVTLGFKRATSRMESVPAAIDDFAFDLVQRQIVIDRLWEEVQSRRQHADDFVRLAVERQRSAHYAGVGAQFADPEAIVEHGRGDCARLVVGAAE